MADEKQQADEWEWKLIIEAGQKGGPGSGNWGHAGRPGQVGGSAPGGGLQRIGIGPESSHERRRVAAERYGLGREGDQLTAAQARRKLELVTKEHEMDTAAWKKENDEITERTSDFFQKHLALMEADDIAGATRLGDEMEVLWKRSIDLTDKIITADRELAQRQRNIIYVDNPAEFYVNEQSRFKDHRRAAIDDGVREFSKMVGTGSLNEEIVNIKAAGRGRSWQSASLMGLTTSGSTWVVVHELGHWLENMDPDVRQKAQTFLAARTQGESARWLGDNYDRHEKAKFDKFDDPYSGKVYGHRATEIMSMGIQQMWKDPVKFARNDPEYFDFIYNTVRGK